MEFFQLMARYNQWFNGQLFEACGELTDRERKADRGAYFRSIHGTLNHILLADKLWLGRLQDQPFKFDGLDQELHSQFSNLRADRQATDAQIIELMQQPMDVSQQLAYTDSFGDARQLPLTQALGHLFNHATHHRGQVTTLLYQAGVDVGITDLARMPGS